VDTEFTEPPAVRVRKAFGLEPTGDMLGAALEALEATDELLFDSVEQVQMDRWHKGRVVLVGDSAWCVTLYAGMGVSAGLAGADLLGTMLGRHGNIERALTEWEDGHGDTCRTGLGQRGAHPRRRAGAGAQARGQGADHRGDRSTRTSN
jgi:2-polyprenyl-6-methoxyphenol hydroxylase-like FAD-dependent oxidoreductase